MFSAGRGLVVAHAHARRDPDPAQEAVHALDLAPKEDPCRARDHVLHLKSPRSPIKKSI